MAVSSTPLQGPLRKQPSTPIKGLHPLLKPVVMASNDINNLLNAGASGGPYVMHEATMPEFFCLMTSIYWGNFAGVLH